LIWLTKHTPFSRQTSDNYRMVYVGRDEPKLLTVSNLTEAYRLLRKAKAQRSPKPQVNPADFAD
jgi:hypothetical protein